LFWNLIRTAIKFAPFGGSLTIRSINDPCGRIVVEMVDGQAGGAAKRGQPNRETSGHFERRKLEMTVSERPATAHGGAVLTRHTGVGRIFLVSLPAALRRRHRSLPSGWMTLTRRSPRGSEITSHLARLRQDEITESFAVPGN
jgi:hypothetical protein